MSHLWQRFLLATALVFGLVLGVGLTVFGYSNLATVDVHWSVWHLDGVPLWAVAVVPIALILVAGTLYHWIDGLHHFSEHMRHRHRVRELEAEVTRLRDHLDHVLEMPRGDATVGAVTTLPAAEAEAAPALASLPPAELSDTDPEMPAAVDSEPAAPEAKPAPERKKRSRIVLEDKPAEPATNGADKVAAASASSTPEV